MNFIYIALLVLDVVQFSRQNVQRSNRIFNGNIAEPHSAPYQVGLFIYRENRTFLCSGTLIKPRFVLTAAHCVDAAYGIQVIIGTNSLENALEIDSPVEAIKYKLHEGWNQTTIENDIAIIALRNPVELNDKIALVDLPTKSDTSSLMGKYGRLTGWGRRSDIPEKNTILMELKVRIASDEECKPFPADSTRLCGFGEQNGNACPGDSGGPLILENTNIQVGVLSFGSIEGCTFGHPHVYTNVSAYLDWIDKWTSAILENVTSNSV